MSIQKFTIRGQDYAYYSKTLFRIGRSVDDPENETPYYVEVGDMSRSEGILESDMVVRFRYHDVLNDGARIICEPNDEYEFGLIHLEAIDTIRVATPVDEVESFPDDGDWSWQSAINRMFRDPNGFTPPLLVSATDDEEALEQLTEWADETPMVDVLSDIPRGIVLVCPEETVQTLCEFEFVRSVELEGIGTQLD